MGKEGKDDLYLRLGLKASLAHIVAGDEADITLRVARLPPVWLRLVEDGQLVALVDGEVAGLRRAVAVHDTDLKRLHLGVMRRWKKVVESSERI